MRFTIGFQPDFSRISGFRVLCDAYSPINPRITRRCWQKPGVARPTSREKSRRAPDWGDPWRDSKRSGLQCLADVGRNRSVARLPRPHRGRFRPIRIQLPGEILKGARLERPSARFRKVGRTMFSRCWQKSGVARLTAAPPWPDSSDSYPTSWENLAGSPI